MNNERDMVHPEFGEARVMAILGRRVLHELPVVKEHLPKVFPNVDVVCPDDLDHLKRLLERSRETHPLALAIGGDGTLHQVLRGLNTEKQALGILPAGTGNDFARIMGFPTSLPKRIEHLSTLSARPMDYGKINGTRFINSGGFGIDSEVLLTRERSKGFIARNYNAAFIVTLARLTGIQAKIECDGEQLSGRYFWILAMNSPFIGGGTKVAPEAKVDDGKLDLLLVCETKKFNLVKYLMAAIKGNHLSLKLCTYRQVSKIRIELAKKIDYLALDGELLSCGKQELNIEVVESGLRFLY